MVFYAHLFFLHQLEEGEGLQVLLEGAEEAGPPACQVEEEEGEVPQAHREEVEVGVVLQVHPEEEVEVVVGLAVEQIIFGKWSIKEKVYLIQLTASAADFAELSSIIASRSWAAFFMSEIFFSSSAIRGYVYMNDKATQTV